MANKSKNFEDHIIRDNPRMVTLQDYQSSPAKAFLKYVVDAKDASVACTKKFKSSKRKTPYTTDATDSISIINAGLLAAIMGNYETFQKYLFARMFDYSIYLNRFNVKEFINKIYNNGKHYDGKNKSIEVDFIRFSAFRDKHVSVGYVLADQLKNWQAPEIVNNYFRAFQIGNYQNKQEFYSNEEKNELSILWQMRHSIVHTAGTITLPDSQKITALHNFGGVTISLGNQFIYEVARKLHPLVKNSTDRMAKFFTSNLKDDVTDETRRAIDKLFKVSSSCSTWLK